MASKGAGENKKRTSSKPASSKGVKSKTSKSSRETKKQGQGFEDEISILVVTAIAVIMVLSCFGLAGDFGKWINDFMFGMIGIMEYVLPIVLVLSVFFIVANKQLSIVRIKVAAAFLMIFCMSGLVQKLSKNPDPSMGLGKFYANSSQEHVGGGLIGGIICKILSPLGTGGTFVILLLIMVICLLFITERSVLKGIKRGGKHILDTAKDDYEAYREHSIETRRRREEIEEQEEEEYRQREEIRRQRRRQQLEEIRKKEEEDAKKPKRRDKKARGVMLSTEVDGEDFEPTPIAGGDLKELTLEIKKTSDDFKINDDFSKDIFDPNAKNDVLDDVEDKEGSFAGPSDVKEFRAKPVVNTDIMPVTKEKLDDASVNVKELKQDNKVAQGVANEVKSNKGYSFPPITLLKEIKKTAANGNLGENEKTAKKLQQTLQNFGVHVTITGTSCGPTVTRYELQPEQGTKVAKIVSLSDDIKLNLAASDIRIEAPIPGKSAIGIEVPNKEATGVGLRELLESKEFKSHPSPIAFAAGKDIAGNVIVADIAKMPHVLIAGATGSGKSVCINTIIMSILYKARPDDVKLILIDPKVVELSVYNGIPHLSLPVVTDPKKAASTLNWAVAEMTDRYKKFADEGVRDLKGYNEKMKGKIEAEGLDFIKMPQIVIIIDELADLMMVASGEVEDAICRLAQLARAAGIHLVIATQRPSVNVVTGLIKANVPSRIAFSVSSGVDSRTILDMNGAEKLLGKGDMLFYPSGYPKPIRVQGAFVSDSEVGGVVEFLKSNTSTQYDESVMSQINSGVNFNASLESSSGGDRDEYFADAGRFIIEKEKASIGMLQRYYKIGFNRAARIMDQLCDAKVVGPEEGTKPRKILMTAEEFEQLLRQ